MTVVDLGPAASRMADLVRGVPDGRLDGPTPCPAYTVGDLLDHIRGMATAFTAAATKTVWELGEEGPSGDASRLGEDWKASIPRDLETLAEAWRDPAAWTGMTRAGGHDMPGEIGGLVTLTELVVHGWDLARASGQPYSCEPAMLRAVHRFVAHARRSDDPPEELFGPVVSVPDDAPLLDHVIGLTGRNPAWSPG